MERLAQTPEHSQYCAKAYAFAMKSIYDMRDTDAALQLMAGIDVNDVKSLARAKELAQSFIESQRKKG